MATDHMPAGATPVAAETRTASGGGTLKVGALGLFGVLFMAVANAAPITAMTGNLPIAVG